MFESPPIKRMKLQSVKRPYLNHSDENKENLDPRHAQPNATQEVRKRKVPVRRSPQRLNDLNTYVLLNVFDYLNYDDLCNLCNTSVHLRDVARKSFMLRGSNGINFHLAQSPNGATLLRLLETFGDLITTINISTSIN